MRAARPAPGDRRKAHPRRAQLGAPRYRRTGLRRIGRASAPPHGQGLAATPGLAAAGCANACRPRRWRFSPMASRRRFTRLRRWSPSLAGNCRTAPLAWPAWCGGACLRPGRGDGVLPKSGGRAAEVFVRGCRVRQLSIREWFSPGRPCLVVNPGGSRASVAATFRHRFFPLLRIPRATKNPCLQALHCVAPAGGAASPSPAGRITTRTRWARTLFHR